MSEILANAAPLRKTSASGVAIVVACGIVLKFLVNPRGQVEHAFQSGLPGGNDGRGIFQASSAPVLMYAELKTYW